MYTCISIFIPPASCTFVHFSTFVYCLFVLCRPNGRQEKEDRPCSNRASGIRFAHITILWLRNSKVMRR